MTTVSTVVIGVFGQAEPRVALGKLIVELKRRCDAFCYARGHWLI